MLNNSVYVSRIKIRILTIIFALFQEPPLNVTIENATDDGYLYGIENQSLDLVCSVDGEVPDIVINWYNGKSFIIKGLSKSLTLQTMPNRRDDKAAYRCEVESSALTRPLRKTIYLHIQCKLK